MIGPLEQEVREAANRYAQKLSMDIETKAAYQRQLAAIMSRTKMPGWAFCSAKMYSLLLKEDCLNASGIEHMRGFLDRMGEFACG